MKKGVILIALSMMLLLIPSCGDKDDAPPEATKESIKHVKDDPDSEKTNKEYSYVLPEGFIETDEYEYDSEDPETVERKHFFSKDNGFGFTLTITKSTEDGEDDVQQLLDFAETVQDFRIGKDKVTVATFDNGFEQYVAIIMSKDYIYEIATDEPVEDTLLSKTDREIFLTFVKGFRISHGN